MHSGLAKSLTSEMMESSSGGMQIDKNVVCFAATRESTLGNRVTRNSRTTHPPMHEIKNVKLSMENRKLIQLQIQIRIPCSYLAFLSTRLNEWLL